MHEQSETRRGRIRNIAVGYVAAVVVAGVVLSGLIGFVPAFQEPQVNVPLGSGLTLLLAIVAIPVTIIFTVLPAAAIIWFAERNRVRSPLFYGAAGALTNLAVLGTLIALADWASFQRGEGLRLPSAVAFFQMVLLLTPGLCAGLMYWKVAGRNAGRVPSAPAAPEPTTA
jgi:hypothetical protein